MTNKDPNAIPEMFTEAWFKRYSKVLIIAAAVVVAVVLGGYLAIQSARIKRERAELAYDDSQRLLFGGELQQAEVALRNVMSRYEGTTSATLAGLRMAVLKLDQQRIGEAMATLDEAEKSANKRLFGASIAALRASAMSDSGLVVEAGREYLKAAAATSLDRDKREYKYLAATMFAEGGDNEQALSILTDLSEGPIGPNRSRARLMLGELNAAPAKAGSAG